MLTDAEIRAAELRKFLEEMRKEAGPLPACGPEHVLEFAMDMTNTLLFMHKEAVDKINELTKRIKELESRPIPKYCGTWNRETEFQEGSFVTDNGSIWYAKMTTTGIKPSDGVSWQLACKHGRDGRDGKDGASGARVVVAHKDDPDSRSR